MPSAAAVATPVSGTRTADVGSLPQHGDVVVTREGGSVVAYTILQLPGGAQVSAGLREKALHHRQDGAGGSSQS